jgi:tRNA1Val (adenine37-N6)-methyltransferase
MANDYFKFKQFTIWQDKCAMKVGTDGTLLGAWAHGGKRILDIGTGTGLIAIMMAQRFPEAQVTGVDIDASAVEQARENVRQSPFSDRINIVEADICQYTGQYDCIVSNPPFFENSLVCPDSQRSIARHDTGLSYARLFKTVKSLLTDDGCFSLVVPFDYKNKIFEEAALNGFFLHREWSVQTTPRKQPKRLLLTFALHGTESIDAGVGLIEDAPGLRSSWYAKLTSSFYIR